MLIVYIDYSLFFTGSVQVLFPAVTEAEFAKIVGDWFRYAPRKKGGSKQRGTVEEKEQLDP